MPEDFDRLKAQKDRIEREQRAAMLAPALSIARRAVNGWACYAKREIEHDEITKLHREIDEAARAHLDGVLSRRSCRPSAARPIGCAKHRPRRPSFSAAGGSRG